ncbi:hypothetical protein [Priestia megaterium]|uniref:hypothetical protein n=1 Tax=Priestia megaterium TaxID=1404 RepID=UPI003A7F9BB7
MIQYLPLVSAFVGAIVAQLLSHWYSLKREKRKEAKEIYQNFIYPNLTDVILLHKTETDFRKGHDVENFVNRELLMENISANIGYGDENLITAILKYRSANTFFDGQGHQKDAKTLNVLFWFLDYSIAILKKIKIDREELMEELKLSQKYYGIWCILTEIYGFEDAIQILSWSWIWSDDFLEELLLEELKILMEQEKYKSYSRTVFIKALKRQYIETKTGEYKHIHEILDSYLNE